MTRRIGSVCVVFLLLILGCSQIPQSPEEATKNSIYCDADYFALIKVDYVASDGREYIRVGTGFLIKPGATYYIITAGHVLPLREARTAIHSISVTLKYNKKAYAARIYDYSNEYDIAILQIADRDFCRDFQGKTAILDDSDTCQINDTVYALGHPNNNYWRITDGKITQLNAKSGLTLHTKNNYMCHSALIGIGSSGGPLLNAEGKIIGMNVIMVVQNENDSTSNTVYALPSNVIKEFIAKKLGR